MTTWTTAELAYELRAMRETITALERRCGDLEARSEALVQRCRDAEAAIAYVDNYGLFLMTNDRAAYQAAERSHKRVRDRVLRGE